MITMDALQLAIGIVWYNIFLRRMNDGDIAVAALPLLRNEWKIVQYILTVLSKGEQQLSYHSTVT